jgi:hypothetical protein
MEVYKKENYLGTGLNCVFFSNNKKKTPGDLINVLNIFNNNIKKIETNGKKHIGISSNQVLDVISKDLLLCDYKVETGKKKDEQIIVKIVNCEKYNDKYKEFRVDAINVKQGVIIEIEAGRAVSNYQVLKDIMECSMIASKKNIYVNNLYVNFSKELYLILAVRNDYRSSNNYNTVKKWINTIDKSNLKLGLSGILLIGY